MKIQSCEAHPAISFSLRTTLATIQQDVGDTPQKLLDALAAADLESTGPMVFVYRDMSAEMPPEKSFDLEIALPVADSSTYSGDAQRSTLGALKYVETVHEGDLATMGEQTYAGFLQAIAEAGLQTSTEIREVYTHFVSPDAPANITHIQIGVQA